MAVFALREDFISSLVREMASVIVSPNSVAYNERTEDALKEGIRRAIEGCAWDSRIGAAPSSLAR